MQAVRWCALLNQRGRPVSPNSKWVGPFQMTPLIADGIIGLLVLASAIRGARIGGITSISELVTVFLTLFVDLNVGEGVEASIRHLVDTDQATARNCAIIGLTAICQIVLTPTRVAVEALVRPMFIGRVFAAGGVGVGALAGGALGALVIWMFWAILASGFSSSFVLVNLGSSTLLRVSDDVAGSLTRVGSASGDADRQRHVPAGPTVIDPGPEVLRPRSELGRPDAAAEALLLILVNAARIEAGLRPVVRDPRLDDVARTHSAEMLRIGYFEHTSSLGGSPEDRMTRGGVFAIRSAENIAFASNVREAHTGLLASPHHRAVVLDDGFSRIGIGVVTSPIGTMVTQHFAS